MKLKYRQQIFLWFFIAFACFTTGIMLFQQRWERNIKIENLKNNLDGYAAIVHRYIQERDFPLGAGSSEQMTDVLNLLPPNLRITIIDRDGELLFDNRLADIENVENHLKRKEIQQALKNGSGSDIRLSQSMDIKFFYLAHAYDRYYIRVALPYNIEVQNIIRPDNWFLYFTSILFLTVLVVLIYISGRLGKAITGLRDFIFSVNSENGSETIDIQFPNTEFGEIAGQIVANYRQLRQAKDQLALEKEKLDLCFQNSDEGIGVFSESFEAVFVNTRFVTFVNTILDNHNVISKALFDTEDFSNVRNFLDNQSSHPGISFLMGKIAKNGKHFSLKCIVFHDNSFQIILTDITQSETTRLLKQEMTNNIAHELRTPVSSIRGYLETMLEQENLDIQKQRSFIERSYQQTLKLSELIRDIALITKIEEAPHLFLEETVNVASVLQELKEEFEIPFHANDIAFEDNVSQEIEVTGNRTLIYSIFRNLIENVVTYAGKGITISVDIYNESSVRYFFSFSDTGIGVAEEHLSKMFNRFYRTDEGRTRDSGGSGLGLAIVKNAVQFHQGDIIAKNRKDGGLEFLFTLKKVSY